MTRFVLEILIIASLAPAAERVSFSDALQRARCRNPSLIVAAEEIHRAEAQVEEARSQWMPTLSANGSYTRIDGDRTLNGNVILPAGQLNANLLLSVPLVQSRGWVNWSHAKNNVEVARSSQAEVARQLVTQVARTYLGIIAQKRGLEVLERAIAAGQAHYDFAHQRFTAGYGSRLDQVRAAGEVAADRAALERAQSDLVRLEEVLGVLIGSDQPVDTADDAPVLGEPPASTDAALKEASEKRADLLLERRRLDYARKLRKDAWADYLPTLSGSFQIYAQNPPTLTVPSKGWQAQLLLSWPIYDGGLRYGLQKERRALEREAQAQLEGTQRQAASEVRAAEEEVRRSVAALEQARESAARAQEALDLTQLGYKAGASTNIEVIDAERSARDAATAVALAEDTWRQATLDLLLASGRFQ
jgi:outer membrane protein TolC